MGGGGPAVRVRMRGLKQSGIPELFDLSWSRLFTKLRQHTLLPHAMGTGSAYLPETDGSRGKDWPRWWVVAAGTATGSPAMNAEGSQW